VFDNRGLGVEGLEEVKGGVGVGEGVEVGWLEDGELLFVVEDLGVLGGGELGGGDEGKVDEGNEDGKG
ncbi:hypothetical protein, partial [Neisseria sicca]|uniref:hypothetical protein n=1 Tax=Neisseria sicca TaxID=490 RepID=UPI001C9A2082